MNAKFFRRTLRNVVFRNRPYFAHLALTHRCNLRCRFCHVTETQFRELDTAGMKRVIDVLDREGVAVLSISGGGEPLLRDDFDEIINHAALRGLYTKLTSNGTMPRAKYARLLASAIDEIGISLDGVTGHDLPFSHVGSPILATLQFLNDNLPQGKSLTINVTVSGANRDQVQEILDYCAAHYPRARVWLNPVVAGEGALRTSQLARIEPTYLQTATSETRLRAGFYERGAQAQFENEPFDWHCRAGEMFFDVKPNGDFWFCQDQACPVPLNVLDPAFPRLRKMMDKSPRRACSGCIYSCYFLVQKSMEPKNWPDLGLLWWQAHTQPGGPERQAAEKYGLAGALGSLLRRGLARSRPAAATAAMLLLALLLPVAAQDRAATLPPEEVLTRMEQVVTAQHGALQHWSQERIYRAGNSRLRRSAMARVRVEFAAPDRKTWTLLEWQGSRLIVDRVLIPLLEAEREAASSATTHATDILRSNYALRYAGFDDSRQAYLFEATPLHPARFHFRGRVLVDARTFGVRQTEGEPAVRPSFWVLRTAFVHEYEQYGGFWLPARHRTRVDLRLLGASTLEIDYGSYEVNAGSSVGLSAAAQHAARQLP